MSSEATPIDTAYKELFGGNPPFASSQEMALRILEDWSRERLGDRNALAVLCYILIFVEFSTGTIRTMVFLSAHEKMIEILGEVITVRDAGNINNWLNEGKSVEEIRNILSRHRASDPWLK